MILYHKFNNIVFIQVFTQKRVCLPIMPGKVSLISIFLTRCFCFFHPDQAQKKVKALTAILRIAVALERSNFSTIQQVNVMYDNGAYTIVSVC